MRKLNKFTYQILDYLQRRKRIYVLLYLHEHGVTKWGDIKISDIKVNDGTFRRAVRELTKIGLACAIPIDEMKNKWVLTDLGCLVADIIKRAIRDVGILVENKVAD